MTQTANDYTDPCAGVPGEAVMYAHSLESLRGSALPSVTTPVLVISNGSGSVQPIGHLFAALANNTLDPRFEQNGGGFVSGVPGRPDVTSFFGNFVDRSHVFRVDCLTTSETAWRLRAAIDANVATEKYAAARVEYTAMVAARSGREALDRRGAA